MSILPVLMGQNSIISKSRKILVIHPVKCLIMLGVTCVLKAVHVLLAPEAIVSSWQAPGVCLTPKG